MQSRIVLIIVCAGLFTSLGVVGEWYYLKKTSPFKSQAASQLISTSQNSSEHSEMIDNLMQERDQLIAHAGNLQESLEVYLKDKHDETHLTNLKKNVDELTNEFLEAQNHFTKKEKLWEEQRKELEQIVLANQSQMDELNLQLVNAQETASGLQEAITNLLIERDSATKAVEEHKNHLTALNEKFLETDNTLQTKKESNSSLEEAVASLLIERDAAHKAIEAYQEKNSLLISQIEEAEKSLQSNNTTILSLENALTKLSSERIASMKNIESFKEKNEKLAAQLEETEKSLQNSKEAISKYESSLASLTQEHSQSKEKSEILAAQLEETNKTLQNSKKAISKYESSLASLTQEHSESKEKLEDFQKKNSELQSQLAEAEKTLKINLATLTTFESNLAALTHEHSASKEKIENYQKNNAQLQTQLAVAEKTVKNNKETLANHEINIATLTHERDSSQESVKNLTKTNQEMIASLKDQLAESQTELQKNKETLLSYEKTISNLSMERNAAKEAIANLSETSQEKLAALSYQNLKAQELLQNHEKNLQSLQQAHATLSQERDLSQNMITSLQESTNAKINTLEIALSKEKEKSQQVFEDSTSKILALEQKVQALSLTLDQELASAEKTKLNLNKAQETQNQEKLTLENQFKELLEKQKQQNILIADLQYSLENAQKEKNLIGNQLQNNVLATTKEKVVYDELKKAYKQEISDHSACRDALLSMVDALEEELLSLRAKQ